MFKLMDFISGKKAEQQIPNANSKDNNKNKKATGSPVVRSDINRVLPPHPGKNVLTKTPTPPVIKVSNNQHQPQQQKPQSQQPQQQPQQPQQQPPEKPKFTRKEREEIRNTMSAFQGTEAHEILMKQLAEFELQSLADLSADIELNDSDDSESSDNSYGTFCIKDIKESNGSSNDDESDNYGTFCMKNSNSDDDSFGTMCISSDSKKTNNNATPDFANMFREPEEWEKYILALEKGEWVDGMAEKGAFKRWKKDRPHMPSAYMRDSPFANVMKK